MEKNSKLLILRMVVGSVEKLFVLMSTAVRYGSEAMLLGREERLFAERSIQTICHPAQLMPCQSHILLIALVPQA